MLDDGTERNVAESLSAQFVLFHQGAQRCRHHVLIGTAPVVGVRPAKRNA
jgi:hypothetical protein